MTLLPSSSTSDYHLPFSASLSLELVSIRLSALPTMEVVRWLPVGARARAQGLFTVVEGVSYLLFSAPCLAQGGWYLRLGQVDFRLMFALVGASPHLPFISREG